MAQVVERLPSKFKPQHCREGEKKERQYKTEEEKFVSGQDGPER
jgi:hypothetical protein